VPQPSTVKRLAAPLLSAALLAAGAPRAAAAQPPAGGGGQPEKFENLKVLPENTPRDSLLGIMRGFTAALGVQCQYCHVQEAAPEGAPGPRMRLRPALDDKQTKLTARFMMRMADSLNRVVLAALPKRHEPAVSVSCITCHHGSPLPQTIGGALAETIQKQGVDSAIARYRALRANMASGRYDFTETPINELAQSLAAQGQTQQALAFLNVNQEFYPNSPDVDFAFAEVYRRAGDKNNAITRYRAVLTKRPNDMRARQRLQELGAEPAPVRKDP
jgi:hypothetical protein